MLDLQPVFKALDVLQNEFKTNPTLYFTEHDIASRCYHLVQNALNYQTVGKEGQKFYLVHHEYPTPFRCDMSGTNFEVKGEDKKTPKNGKFQRGHYDLVVFNPDFLKECSYKTAKGQDYDDLKNEMPTILKRIGEPPIMLGVEFMLNRNPFKSTEDAERWVLKVLQDHSKLEASVIWKDMPFMKEYLMLAFDGADKTPYTTRVEQELRDKDGLVYVSTGGE